MSRPALTLFPLCPTQAMQDALDEGEFKTLAELLQAHPAASRQPLDAATLACPLTSLTLRLEAQRLHLPQPAQAESKAAPTPSAETAGQPALPGELSHGEAVALAYQHEIARIAGFLRAELSVLVHCDKLLVPFLQGEIATLAGKRMVVLEEEPAATQLDALAGGKRSRLRELLAALKSGDLLVLPHLDLLAAGDSALSKDARALVEDLFAAADTLLLAFADRSLNLPEVIGQRFAVRLELGGLPRLVQRRDGTVPLGCALVTAAEAASFTGFDAEALYKNVAGLNPIRLRQALAYARGEEAAHGPVAVDKLYQAIRAFKAQTTANFTVPDVTFDQIGGYSAVKARMLQVLAIMLGAHQLPNEALRRELLPRGFIFHGPPGTGKTLFAKAVANKLNATIQVVSGPEVTDMYVGESERKVRALFAEARRNAPAVLVFDEFDAIATQRSNRDDGGSRAGNALVAQILTEMDGFRPEVPVLVIGTTNRLDIIDDALLRPSRFQAIEIGLPDLEARHAIAAVHARHFGIAIDDALLDLVAQATNLFNGDQIRNLFREACVGLHCHRPPQPADAERLGFLVGQTRQEVETRSANQAKNQPGTYARQRDRQGANAMILLTPEVPHDLV